MTNCIATGCKKNASWGFRFGESLYCKIHGMEYGAKKRCMICMCGRSRPCFGNVGDETPSCCNKCKIDGMKDIRHKRCRQEICENIPSFNFEEKKKEGGIYCSLHKLEGMNDVVSKRCKHEGCRKAPIFNFEEKKKERGIYCLEHKLDGMIDVINKKCKKCNKQPVFNFEEKKKEGGIYCSEHKLDGMVDIFSKRCKHEGCRKAPVFNFEEKKKEGGIYCSEHKLDGMFDIKSKKCIFNGCNKNSSFNFEEKKEEGSMYCFEHMKNGMINIKNKKCQHEGCNTKASFNFEERKKEGAIYCSNHKINGMIDIISKKCLHKGCKKYPSFNFKENMKKGVYCSDHILDGMINVKHKRCQHEECKKIPHYNLPGNKKGIYCSTHKKEGMRLVGNRQCPGAPGLQGPSGLCPFEYTGNKKYDNYCTECFARAFPTDPRTALIRKHSEELKVRDHILTHFPDYEWIHDKPIYTHNCDCSHRRRIDLRTTIGATLLCIEVDEHQHKDRDQTDEELRYDDIYMLLSAKYVFVRYNPHPFTDSAGTRQDPPDLERLRTLRLTVEEQIRRIESEANTEILEIVRLYFDH